MFQQNSPNSPFEPRVSPSRAIFLVFRSLVAIDLLLVLAHLSRLPLHDHFWGQMKVFDLDQESALGTWVSSTQFLIVGALLAGVALAAKSADRPRVLVLWGFALLFAALSMDETAQVHEALGHRLDILLPGGVRAASSVPHTGLWMFAVGPPFIVVFVLFIRELCPFFARAPDARRWMAWGAVVWLFGALGLESLSNFTVNDYLANGLEVAAEEGCELLGVTMMLRGAHLLAEAWRVVINLAVQTSAGAPRVETGSGSEARSRIRAARAVGTGKPQSMPVGSLAALNCPRN